MFEMILIIATHFSVLTVIIGHVNDIKVEP